MSLRSRNFDWQLFWLLEAIFLSLPTLTTVIAFRDGLYLSRHRAAVLVFVLIGLTVLNLMLIWSRGALTDRIQKHLISERAGGEVRRVRILSAFTSRGV